jgi:phosphoribosylglycinamide formyltransferase-1
MVKIGILASGSGTNAEKIMEHFADSSLAQVALLASDNPEAGALERARRRGVPTAVFSRAEFASGDAPLAALRAAGVDYLVLAGFLRLIPVNIIEAYPGRIVNIHPALLPAYGGKGMYGSRVHEAVVADRKKTSGKIKVKSGITIHKVNERYDEGAIIRTYKVDVLKRDTPEMLADKIHSLEHKYFPREIEREIKKMKRL